MVIFYKNAEDYGNCENNKTGICNLKSTDFVYHSCLQDLAIMNLFNMNVNKVNIYKQVLRDICNKYEGAKDFINKRIE